MEFLNCPFNFFILTDSANGMEMSPRDLRRSVSALATDLQKDHEKIQHLIHLQMKDENIINQLWLCLSLNLGKPLALLLATSKDKELENFATEMCCNNVRELQEVLTCSILPKGNNALHRAAAKGMTGLLKMAPDKNPVNSKSQTLLHASAANNQRETVEFLFMYETLDKEPKDNDGKTPIDLAIENDSYAVLEYLYAFQTNANNHPTVLHIAADYGNLGLVRYLISQQENLEDLIAIKTNEGLSAINIAARNYHYYLTLSHKDIVFEILTKLTSDESTIIDYLSLDYQSKDEIIEVLSSYKISPTNNCLQKEARNGQTCLLKVALNKEPINEAGRTPLEIAFIFQKTEVIEYIVEYTCQIKRDAIKHPTLLHLFAHAGKLNLVKYILSMKEYSNELDTVSKEGLMALNLAAQKGHEDIAFHILEKLAMLTLHVNKSNNMIFKTLATNRNQVLEVITKKEISRSNELLHKAAAAGNLVLLQVALNKEPKNWQGETPLHAAAAKGHVELVKYLINHGININVKCQNKMTPLHFASLNGHEDIVQILLKHDDIESDAKNKYDQNALQLAVECGYGKVVSIFEQHGFKLEGKIFVKA